MCDSESPLPKHPEAFQSFPSQAAGEKCVWAQASRFDTDDWVLVCRKSKPYASPSAPTRLADKKAGGGGGNYDLVLDPLFG